MAADEGHQLTHLRTLGALGDHLNRAPDLEQALPGALELVVDALPEAVAAWLYVARTEHGDRHFTSFRLDATHGVPAGLAAAGCAPLREGGCECHGRFRRGELDRGLNLVRCSRLEETAEEGGDTDGLVVHASVPLRSIGDAPFGILNVAAPGADYAFGERELALLEAVGSQLGAACHRAQLLAQREQEVRHRATLEERHRVAREVHDSVAQLLFGAELSLRAVLEVAEGPLAEQVGRSAELIDRALGELRGLVELLRLGELEDGLAPALRRLAGRLGAAVDIHLDLDAVEPSRPLTVALYRAAQEGIHNALRHAGARNVWVRLAVEDDALRLSIDDDGAGWPAEIRPGLGLASMRERAADLSGEVRTMPSDYGGARLQLEVPWPSGS